MKTPTETAIEQYANSPIILSLIQAFNDSIDPREDMDAFYYNVWNIASASGYGLDVWGRIVNVPRSAGAYNLNDDDYRTLILVKAFANISNSSAQVMNQILTKLFSSYGRCYVNDLGGMHMAFVFEFLLTPAQLAIVTQSGVMPRPTGVYAGVAQVPRSTTFGFYGSGLRPFNQGTFFSGLVPVL